MSSMRRSLTISAVMHVGALLFAVLGLPRLMPPPLLPPPTIIPIEIADISDITNTRVKDKSDTEKPSPPVQKPTPQPTTKPVEQTKAAPPPPQQKPPEPVKDKPKPSPVKDVKEDDALALKKKKHDEKKKEEPKPNPADLTAVLKNLATLKNTQPSPDKPKAKVTESAAPAASSNAPALSDRLTISQEDALRRQISQCWNIPIGARNAEQLLVDVRIEVNPDRTVRTAEVVDQARMALDPFFRAAAESALRALRHPRCTPLMLPPDGYETWKNITFTFNPQDVL